MRLPRLYLAWLTPRRFAPGDATLDVLAAVLADGKNSRLYKRLVYDTQMAQDVTAYQRLGALGSSFRIIATARPGHTAAELQQAIDEEIARVQREPPTAREVERALNQIEASFYRGMERVGGFGGKADQLNDYFASGGGPDFFAEDLARYTALTPADVQAAASRVAAGGAARRARRRAGGDAMRVWDDSRGTCALRVGGRRRRKQPPDRSEPPALGPPPRLTLPAVQKRDADERASRVCSSSRTRCRSCRSTSSSTPAAPTTPRVSSAWRASRRRCSTKAPATRSALEIADAVEFLGAELSTDELVRRFGRALERADAPASSKRCRSWPTWRCGRRSRPPSSNVCGRSGSRR